MKCQNLGLESSVKFVILCDSSLGNLPDGETKKGHFFAPFGLFSSLTWQSKESEE